MLLADCSRAQIEGRLQGEGVALDLGAARVRIRSDCAGLAEAFQHVYADFEAEAAEGFFDVTAALTRRRGLRRLVARQVEFVVDGARPFEPFPADTHLPLLEWGLNWCLANRCGQHLLLHAGVVEKHGLALVLPAIPGSGKSTLTAALMLHGYRLLSDEFGVVRLYDGELLPMLRPIALKNESIGVIASRHPSARRGPEFPRTRKGTVSHLAPSAESVRFRHVPATPALVLFPRYVAGAPLLLERVPQVKAFAKLAINSFNYESMGVVGFDAVSQLVARCPCYRLSYADLDAALAAIDELVDDTLSRRRAQAPAGRELRAAGAASLAS